MLLLVKFTMLIKNL